MVEQVKTSKNKSNFYLTIINQINATNSIAGLSNISKQSLNYYTNRLKKLGLIRKAGYGTWELTKKYEQVKEQVKDFSLGTRNDLFRIRPKTNLHALNIKFPILKGQVRDKDWIVREKLTNWIPKYKNMAYLGGLKVKNNNNKSITVYAKTRDLDSLEDVDNLSFKIRTYIYDYFRKEGVILDIMNCEVKNINLATEDKDSSSMVRKGERFELDLDKKAEKIFPQDKIDAKAWIDNSPFLFSAETNNKEWKREYLSMPFRIRDLFGLINTQLELLYAQTKSSTALAKNIESHIPAWTSNIRVEQELRKLRKVLSQKSLKEWL